MRTRTIAACLAAVSIAAIAGFTARPAPAEKPLWSLTGSYSEVAKPRVEVIGDAARWELVWKEHMGAKIEKNAIKTDVVPQVDFSRCVVVAMFSGKSVNSTGWHVVSMHEDAGRAVIRYDETGFQSESFNGEDKGWSTSGYGFAMLNRTALPMTLEENTQSLIDRDPVWTERQRLPAFP